MRRVLGNSCLHTLGPGDWKTNYEMTISAGTALMTDWIDVEDGECLGKWEL
jgi:hypothetical protein